MINNILKRVLVGVAVGVILYLLKGYILMNVSARTISMAQPTTFGYWTSLDNSNSTGTYSTENALSANYVNIPSYRSTTLESRSFGGVAFEWTGANLCVDNELTVSGIVHTANVTSVTFASGYFNSWTQQKSCEFFNTGSNNGYRFTCNGTGGGGLVLYFGYNLTSDYPGYLYLERDLDIYCDASANDIINNANNNTTSIINNQNSNTEQITNAINEANQETIESQKVCQFIDKNSIVTNGKYLQPNGNISNASAFGITDYINIYDADIDFTSAVSYISNQVGVCYYNVNKDFISCENLSSITYLTVPTDAYYLRSSIYKSGNKPTYKICKNGNQAIQDSLTDDDVSGAESKSQDFFLNFADPVNPLQDVLMFPINLFAASTESCSPLTFTILEQEVILPCGDELFWDREDVSSFRTWWNMFVGGFSIYLLCFKLFHIISDSFDPFIEDLGKVRGI